MAILPRHAKPSYLRYLHGYLFPPYILRRLFDRSSFSPMTLSILTLIFRLHRISFGGVGLSGQHLIDWRRILQHFSHS